jgi:hypothetical protein
VSPWRAEDAPGCAAAVDSIETAPDIEVTELYGFALLVDAMQIGIIWRERGVVCIGVSRSRIWGDRIGQNLPEPK